MPRKSFRYDPTLEKLVEITVQQGFDAPSIIDDLHPFVSPLDGKVITSRSQLRDYMGEHNLVHHEDAKTQAREEDRYEAARRDQRMRECMWEGVNKTFSMGNKPRR